MKQLLLKTLLSEYLRQLRAGLDGAQAELKEHVKPVRYRAWNLTALAGFRFTEPDESTPTNEWHWKEDFPLHPSLTELAEVIARMDAFVAELANDATEE